MFRKISRDVKIAALNLHENGILPLPDILACVGFSESTFYRILRLWRETGEVVSHRHGNKAGHPRILHFDDVQYLLRLVQHRPDWFLDELLNLLKRNRFVSVHYTTIHRELDRAGMSRKKLKIIAKEHNEPLRNDYMRHMAMYSPEQLGFLDETSKNDKTPGRRYGRGRRGRRAQMKQVFVRGRRLSAEGLLTVEGIVASTVVEGSMKRDGFLQFLENQVVRP
jgi:transposase